MVENFSVLIPAHGSCQFIVQTLESICESSILPKQVVIINDGISNITLSTIMDFHPRLSLFIQPNRGSGLVDALNTGIEICQNTFISRLDADDLVTPDRFAHQLDFMRQNPEIVVVGGQVQYIDADGQLLGSSNYLTGQLNELKDFKVKCLIAHPATMIRRNALIDVGGYRSICKKGRVDLAEDFDLWLRLSQEGILYNLKSTVLYYRQHSNQLSARNLPEQLFSTRYISLINQAEKIDPLFQAKILNLQRFKVDFLLESFRSLASFASLNQRIILLLEGSLIYLGISSSGFARLMRKVIRFFNKD